MTVATEQPLLTFEEFLSLPDTEDYELVEGRLVRRKEMGALSNYISAQVIIFLGVYCRQQQAGAVFNAENVYRCFPSPRTIRKPDASFIRASRLSEDDLLRGYMTLVPDLVVEVVSPNDLVYDLEEKLADYRQAGVPLAWVIHPNTRRVRIQRGDGSVAELDGHEQLSGETLLPGFACPIAELFPSFPPAAPKP